MADKVIELLRLMEKFGVKPGKIIGAGDKKVTYFKQRDLVCQQCLQELLPQGASAERHH